MRKAWKLFWVLALLYAGTWQYLLMDRLKESGEWKNASAEVIRHESKALALSPLNLIVYFLLLGFIFWIAFPKHTKRLTRPERVSLLFVAAVSIIVFLWLSLSGS